MGFSVFSVGLYTMLMVCSKLRGKLNATRPSEAAVQLTTHRWPGGDLTYTALTGLECRPSISRLLNRI
jgi:hypothetical protein